MDQLTDVRLLINNKDVPLMPNTFVYTEGLGEQDVKAVSAGGGTIEQLYQENLEMNFSTVKFDMPVTVETVPMARGWKSNKNRNSILAVGVNDEGEITKTFTKAAVTADYEVPIGTDQTISIEFKTSPAT